MKLIERHISYLLKHRELYIHNPSHIGAILAACPNAVVYVGPDGFYAETTKV